MYRFKLKKEKPFVIEDNEFRIFIIICGFFMISIAIKANTYFANAFSLNS